MEDFRSGFREEMKQFREDFQNGKASGSLCDCDISGHMNVRRDSGNEEFHEKQLEFHRDSRTKQAGESKKISYENDEGGN